MRPSLLFALSTLVVAGSVSAAEMQFDAWRGACAETCTLVTPVAFGARLLITPADDGGLGVRLLDIAPEVTSPITLTFPGMPVAITLAPRDWRADGATSVLVPGPHERAAILELLPAVDEVSVEWSAEGGPRAAALPTAGAGASLDWLVEVTGAHVRIVDQEAPRVTWSEDPSAFLAAIDACRRDATTPLLAVLHAGPCPKASMWWLPSTSADASGAASPEKTAAR